MPTTRKSRPVARPWLTKLTKFRSSWADYALLSRGEAEIGNNRKAREYLTRAKDLLRKGASPQDKKEAREIFSYIESRLEYNEWRMATPKKEGMSHSVRTAKPDSSLKARAVRDNNIQEPEAAEPPPSA